MDFEKRIKEYYSALTDVEQDIKVPYSPEEELLKIKKTAIARRRVKIRNYTAAAVSAAVIVLCVTSVSINNISTFKQYDDDTYKAMYSSEATEGTDAETENSVDAIIPKQTPEIKIAHNQTALSENKKTSGAAKSKSTAKKSEAKVKEYHDKAVASDATAVMDTVIVPETAVPVERVEAPETGDGIVNSADAVETENTAADNTPLWSGGDSDKASGSSGSSTVSTVKPSASGGKTPGRGSGGGAGGNSIGGFALGTAPMTTVPPYTPADNEGSSVIADTEYEAPAMVKPTPTPSPTPSPTPEVTQEGANN